MPFSYSNNPLYVSEGQTIQFRYKAPSDWDTTETVTIRVGLLEQYWFIVTVPEDFSPDPFAFREVKEAITDTLYVYADGSRPGEQLYTVSGLTPTTQAPIVLSANTTGNTINDYALRIKRNGQSSFEVRAGITDGFGWFIPVSGETVANGDTIQIRLRSSAFSSDGAKLTLFVGSGFAEWDITTKFEPANIPVPFPDFTDLFNIEPGSTVYSDILRLQGLTSPAQIIIPNLDVSIAVSSSNASFTNDSGYDILSGVNFVNANTNPIISNGQYIQLKFTTSFIDNLTTNIPISIGDRVNGSVWSVTNGAALSTTPASFVFIDKSGVQEDTLISSDTQPLTGITGLGNNNVEVDVVLLNTNGIEPKVKITDRDGNESSIGLFPAKVKNGYKITIYNRSSATFGGAVTTQIKVGKTEIPTWTIVTNNGPDTDAVFTPPVNLVNKVPGVTYSSSIVTITDINRPIQINATNGAKISVDFADPVVGPVTFDPNVNTSFQIFLTAPSQLGQTATTQVTVGTGSSGNPFTFSVGSYAVAPPPKTNLGRWYSKKTDKFDGYSIGTVLSVPKEGDGTYGDLSGDLDSRYPGFIECDGSSYPASLYPDLWWVIKNTYGGNASYNSDTKTYSGEFNVPDYRNRKLTGTGVVDGNRGSSAFVPVSTTGKGIYDVGAEGGYWYIDSVDVAGPLPFEQIIGTAGAQSGLSSPFFTLGSPTTVFDAPVTGETEFTVIGSIAGVVGPLSSVVVTTPPHTHFIITAQTDGDNGNPLIPWDEPALLGSVGQGSFYDGYNEGQIGKAPGDEAALRGAAVNEYLTEIPPQFKVEYNKVNTEETLQQVVERLTRITTSQGENAAEVDLGVWYLSPESGVSDNYLESFQYPNDPTIGLYGTIVNLRGNAIGCAIVDTEPSTFRVQNYQSFQDGGAIASHSHLLSNLPVTDPTQDYTFGNTSGIGSGRNGLGGALTSQVVQFIQGVDVFNGMNTGTFTLNQTIKKPVPNVAFVPNRKVPVVSPFHKVKYIIKAY
jgi:hypothetical protein